MEAKSEGVLQQPPQRVPQPQQQAADVLGLGACAPPPQQQCRQREPLSYSFLCDVSRLHSLNRIYKGRLWCASCQEQ